jgi:hypothetical protein
MRTVFKSGKTILAVVAMAIGGAHGRRRRAGIQVPVEYHKLDNGLQSGPLAGPHFAQVVVAVYYGIGAHEPLTDRSRTSSST